MSGIEVSPPSPEAVAPKIKDFAKSPSNTKEFAGSRSNAARNEKHDTTNARQTSASVLRVHKAKENSNTMLKRMKDMALAPLQFGGGKT